MNLIIAASAAQQPIIAPSHDITVLVLGSILVLVAACISGFGPTKPSTLFTALAVGLTGIAVWFL